MISNFKEFVKAYEITIILVIAVLLISLLSFAVGYIVAKEQLKQPLSIEKIQNEKTDNTE